MVGKGEYFRFGMRDSLAIEASFLQVGWLCFSAEFVIFMLELVCLLGGLICMCRGRKSCFLVGGESLQSVVTVQKYDLVPVRSWMSSQNLH